MAGTDLLIAVLGAGLASRFGEAKLDAPCHGRRLGEWAVAGALELGAPVIAVVRPGEQRFLVPFAGRLAGIIVNPEPEAGQGRSVALAAKAALAEGAAHLLVILADMPLVTPETLRRLVAAARIHGIAATLWPDGRRGVPACFGKDQLASLAELRGEAGARQFLRDCPPGGVLAPGDADELVDVDHPADIARATALLAARDPAR